jgi:hypothetical protein
MKTPEFVVCVDEIRQNLAFGERFTRCYVGLVTLSDGSQRTIKLTPVVKDGREMLELDDSGVISWIGLDGSQTNGKLMVRVNQVPDMPPAAISVHAPGK